MEGHIYNATVMHSKKEGFARSVSRGRNGRELEDKVSKMDMAEFLSMFGGAAVIGTSIYLLSFVMI